MNKSIKYIIIIIAVFLIACHELYDYNQIDSKQKVLVVEGSITNDFGPYKIHLSQAIPFSQNKTLNIKGAKVYVKDNSGNMYTFFDKLNGFYVSDSASFRGEIGKTYTLYITTSDGLQFKSLPCTIGQECDIDSIYGLNESMLLIPKGTEENLDDIFGNGFHLYADFSFKANQAKNIRIDVNLASPFTEDDMHYTYTPVYNIKDIFGDPKHPNVVTGRIRTVVGKIKSDSFDMQIVSYGLELLNKLPIIKTANDYSAGSKIKKASLAVMNKTGGFERIDDSTSISWASNWIAQIKAYSISDDAFNYYFNVSKQLNANNNFFEPIPVQLRGNIKCLSDSTKNVFGLFEANSVIIKYMRIDLSNKYEFSHADRLPPTYKDSISFAIIDTSTAPTPTPTPGSPIDTSGFIWP